MNTLEVLVRPVTAVINRQIAAKTPARALCEELDGRTFALRVRDSSLAIYLMIEDGQIILSSDYIEEPDVIVTGSMISLARLSGPSGEDLLRDGSVDISGDAVIASRFRKLFRYGQPDLEEELSSFVGDAAAHGIGDLVRSVTDWKRDAGTTMQQNIGEYLQEESRTVPGRHETDTFRDQVNALRDDVARFEARLCKLEDGLRET
ncbi:MAG: SCP2 sterol-binding domain-containing protein [Pseudomonadota bacterium]|nr:SCP2 sterol-binding domain-containing protein [Pseudomonadota bacterium]